MGYCGTRNIEELRTKTRFIQVTAASVVKAIRTISHHQSRPTTISPAAPTPDVLLLLCRAVGNNRRQQMPFSRLALPFLSCRAVALFAAATNKCRFQSGVAVVVSRVAASGSSHGRKPVDSDRPASA